MTDPKKPVEKDAVSGVETTGHEWDGLKELNNPAPRWWLWVFILTVIWAVGYWVVYPAWPTIDGSTKGKWNWTEYKELADKQGEITARQSQYLAKLQSTKLEDVHNDRALFEFARLGGMTAFKENCAACHAAGGAGTKGYPNLNDDDWLWGGKLSDIYQTIQVGIRSSHPDTRNTAMPNFGKDGVLKPAQIEDVAKYVESMHLKTASASSPGAAIFAEQCAACHGNDGGGNTEMGAPRLNDNIWLYGGSHADIVGSITNAHAGVMPTWKDRLDDNTIKMLAIYVHSLGGGK